MDNCIFCKIIAGEVECTKIWENDSFIAITNKFPEAPVDILVMPKKHLEKVPNSTKSEENKNFQGDLMLAVYEVVRFMELDKKGFRLVINGAGYNHLEHEHVHVLSGLSKDQI